MTFALEIQQHVFVKVGQGALKICMLYGLIKSAIVQGLPRICFLICLRSSNKTRPGNYLCTQFGDPQKPNP